MLGLFVTRLWSLPILQQQRVLFAGKSIMLGLFVTRRMVFVIIKEESVSAPIVEKMATLWMCIIGSKDSHLLVIKFLVLKPNLMNSRMMKMTRR